MRLFLSASFASLIAAIFVLSPTAFAERDGPIRIDINSHPQLDIIVNFGFENPYYSNDGYCDDPRFSGSDLEPTGAWRRDANDCRTALKAGDVDICFGYWAENSQWTALNDNGQCDDPRFDGPGMAEDLYMDFIARDPLECRDMFLAGQIRFSEISPALRTDVCESLYNCGEIAQEPEYDDEDDTSFVEEFDVSKRKPVVSEVRIEAPIPDEGRFADIDFGDDTGRWAKDGICDDPRFQGPGTSSAQPPSEIGKDATDCLFAVAEDGAGLRPGKSGSLRPANSGYDLPPPLLPEDDDFGFGPVFDAPDTLSSEEEAELNEFNEDISDTFSAPDLTSPSGEAYPLKYDGLTLGDDSSDYAFDDECDDPRFEGMGMGANIGQYDKSRGHDASDCLARLKTHDIWPTQETEQRLDEKALALKLKATASKPAIENTSNIDFGDDSSLFAKDTKCHDPRFIGPGMGDEYIIGNAEEGRDATDCAAAYQAGTIQLATDKMSSETIYRSGILFGDNMSRVANNGQCEDMRFEGLGMAAFFDLDEAYIGHDAEDCAVLFEAGRIEKTSTD